MAQKVNVKIWGTTDDSDQYQRNWWQPQVDFLITDCLCHYFERFISLTHDNTHKVCNSLHFKLNLKI